MNALAMLRLASPALPIGAFSWSGGLEGAIEAGVITDEASAARWVGDGLSLGLGRWELPVLHRIHQALLAGDAPLAALWHQRFLASRETRELREETVRMGAALLRLLRDLGAEDLSLGGRESSLPLAWAIAAQRWGLGPAESAEAYAYAWIENQLAAACKALPLGQVAAQRILEGLIRRGGPASEILRVAATLPDAELTSSMPGLAILSARHETQYSRLFRS